jgi:uncharacterized protein YndB with AHSA1/START domain
MGFPNNHTQNSRLIKAKAEKIYQAFAQPHALEKWMTPGDMTAKISNFDFREGGGYTMSLFYPENEMKHSGKSAEKEDRYYARFIELVPNQKIKIAVRFDTNDSAFEGEMYMQVDLHEIADQTNVVFSFEHIPPGIDPKDNEAGTMSTLEKLANWVA